MKDQRIGLRLLMPMILVVLIACKENETRDKAFPVSQSIAAIVGPVEPLSQLDGVRLGMTARELKKVRPGLQVAGYEGYKEQIGDYRIGYSIPGSWSEEQEVTLSNRLVAILASRTFPDDSSAIKLWSETNSKLQTYNGGSARCVRIELSRGHGRAMQWGQVVSAAFLTDTGTVRSKPPDSARFYMGVGKAPGFSAWLTPARPCPEEGVFRVG